jgi:drug/metabolite transporter (DMT)-like permease
MIKFIPVILTIAFTTLGQLAFKVGIDKVGDLPESVTMLSLIQYMFKALLNIWIILGFGSAVFAALSWIIAVSKFELSSIYPYQSINFVLVPLFSILLFGESFNWYKLAGVVVILLGVLVFSKGI